MLIVCSPIRPSRTSQASSIRSNGSQKLRPEGGMCWLDAACFRACQSPGPLRWHPDFVPISFYKMFGYPTGVGCLLARKTSSCQMKRTHGFLEGPSGVLQCRAMGMSCLRRRSVRGRDAELSEPACGGNWSQASQTIGMETIHERIRL